MHTRKRPSARLQQLFVRGHGVAADQPALRADHDVHIEIESAIAGYGLVRPGMTDRAVAHSGRFPFGACPINLPAPLADFGHILPAFRDVSFVVNGLSRPAASHAAA